MQELRITNTNSANDSKGRAFKLEGNNFLYILVAVVFALAVYMFLNAALGVRMTVAASVSLPIVLLPAAWVLFLKNNKPDLYAADLIDSLLNKEGWSFAPRAQPRHDYFQRS